MVLIVLSIHPLHGRKQGLMTDPLILCLGTTNTYGNCKHGDKLHLEESETLPAPSLLSQRLGIHFVNLGVGGVLMTQMTDILIDALEEYDINMCKGVPVEAQQGPQIVPHMFLMIILLIGRIIKIFKKKKFRKVNICL